MFEQVVPLYSHCSYYYQSINLYQGLLLSFQALPRALCRKPRGSLMLPY